VCVDAAADSDSKRLSYDRTHDTVADSDKTCDTSPADSDVDEQVTLTGVNVDASEVPAELGYHSNAEDELDVESSRVTSADEETASIEHLSETAVSHRQRADEPHHVESDLQRHYDDDVRHESHYSSHGNDSGSVVDAGFQGGLDGQAESDVQVRRVLEEMENECQGDRDRLQSETERQEQLNADMQPQPGQDSDSNLDLVTSQPMTSRHVEESEETLDDGTVVRTRVRTTLQVLTLSQLTRRIQRTL